MDQRRSREEFQVAGVVAALMAEKLASWLAAELAALRRSRT